MSKIFAIGPTAPKGPEVAEAEDVAGLGVAKGMVPPAALPLVEAR